MQIFKLNWKMCVWNKERSSPASFKTINAKFYSIKIKQRPLEIEMASHAHLDAWRSDLLRVFAPFTTMLESASRTCYDCFAVESSINLILIKSLAPPWKEGRCGLRGTVKPTGMRERERKLFKSTLACSLGICKRSQITFFWLTFEKNTEPWHANGH